MQKKKYMDIMNIQSIGWLVLTIVLFVIAIVTDEELRNEMKSARVVAGMLFTMIALYYSIMWICNEWLTWCM